VRDPSKLVITHVNLVVIQGDVLDLGSVERCVEGSMAVYVCLGTWGNKPTQVYSMGTENIILAMQEYGIRRIICLSSAGIFGYDGGFFGRVIVPLTLWRPFRDKRKQAEILAASGLDWTLVRPTEIKANKRKGDLVVTYHKPHRKSISVSCLIDYLYNELEGARNFKKMPIIGD
jgi:putative NADH-flavin reductase